mgnify:CR=1 FL=1
MDNMYINVAEGISGIPASWPGYNLGLGTTGDKVRQMQQQLARISKSYPAIPKIPTVDGIFGSRTEASVRAFQQIFGLEDDGIVGKATWYELVRLYVAVNRLAELRSQGQQFYSINWEYPNGLTVGSRGDKVRHLQYMLSVLAAYINEIPAIVVDGIYGAETERAVLAAQRWFGLAQTGVVDATTWDEIYHQFSGIENTTLRNTEQFPPNTGTMPRNRYSRTTTMTQFPGENIQTGSRDPVRQEVVR